MKKVLRQVEQVTKERTVQVLDKTDEVSGQVNATFNHYVEPVRTSVLKRFPVLFSLLAVFGVATTYYAFEKILSQYEVLNRYPVLILILGLSILAFTGKLYKKLD
ncbi:MAG: hypothetical protein ACK42D_03375 [Candidatus Paceibacteria bacterium]